MYCAHNELIIAAMFVSKDYDVNEIELLVLKRLLSVEY
jgi:hypothetical protein